MNPLLLLKFGPYIAIALLAAAWGIQTHRLSGSVLEFTQYKLDQQLLIQQQISTADIQRKESSDAYQTKQKQLEVSIEAGETFARCVRAGKCGVRTVTTNSCTGLKLPSTERVNEASTNTVSFARGDAAISDCAVTTLQLNALQEDIEKQPGYSQ